jgi:hypothetical protein
MLIYPFLLPALFQYRTGALDVQVPVKQDIGVYFFSMSPGNPVFPGLAGNGPDHGFYRMNRFFRQYREVIEERAEFKVSGNIDGILALFPGYQVFN